MHHEGNCRIGSVYYAILYVADSLRWSMLYHTEMFDLYHDAIPSAFELSSLVKNSLVFYDKANKFEFGVGELEDVLGVLWRYMLNDWD